MVPSQQIEKGRCAARAASIAAASVRSPGHDEELGRLRLACVVVPWPPLPNPDLVWSLASSWGTRTPPGLVRSARMCANGRSGFRAPEGHLGG